MLKTWMAGAMMVASVGAHAEQKAFDIVYKGFYALHADEFQPDASLTVSIVVDDLDGNGTYSKDELWELTASNIHYTNGACNYLSCIDYFNWTPGQLPNYSARFQRQDLFNYTLTGIVTGVAYREFYADGGGFSSSQTWEWTPATQTSIIPTSPVPEPSGYAMLGVGLAALAALGRRRHGVSA